MSFYSKTKSEIYKTVSDWPEDDEEPKKVPQEAPEEPKTIYFEKLTIVELKAMAKEKSRWESNPYLTFRKKVALSN